MAGIKAERATLEGYVDTNWTSTPIAWDEVPYSPAAGTSFIKVHVDPAGAEIISMPRGHRYFGVFFIDIYCPRNQGTATIRGYADEVADMFLNQNISGILLRNMTIYKDVEGDWLMWSLGFTMQEDR